MVELNVELDTKEALRELSKTEQDVRKGVRAGLVEVIKPIKKQAKITAPVDKGDLSNSIGHRAVSKTAKQRLGISEDSTALLVGANRKVNGKWQGKKGLWAEHGTKRQDGSQKNKATFFLANSLNDHESGIGERFYKGLKRYVDKKRNESK